MNKPIEAGCRAVIVNASKRNNGIIVNVVDVFGPPGEDMTFPRLGVRWEIKEIIVHTNGMGWSRALNHIGEYNLQRIDDYDGNDIVSWGDMKEVWQPERVEETP